MGGISLKITVCLATPQLGARAAWITLRRHFSSAVADLARFQGLKSNDLLLPGLSQMQKLSKACDATAPATDQYCKDENTPARRVLVVHRDYAWFMQVWRATPCLNTSVC